MVEIVAHHLRNIEVHHVDLDIGYRPADWPSILNDGELPKRLQSLPDRADHAQILAWLLGRAPPAPEFTERWLWIAVTRTRPLHPNLNHLARELVNA